MAIIECTGVPEFKKLMQDYDHSKYRLFITQNGQAILKPSVSTKSLETILVKGLEKKDYDGITKAWNGKVFAVKKFIWKEDRLF